MLKEFIALCCDNKTFDDLKTIKASNKKKYI